MPERLDDADADADASARAAAAASAWDDVLGEAGLCREQNLAAGKGRAGQGREGKERAGRPACASMATPLRANRSGL